MERHEVNQEVSEGYAGTRYVAVGNSGKIIWATDLNGPWTSVGSYAENFGKKAYGNGYLVATLVSSSSTGTIFYSSNNGDTWTQVSTIISISYVDFANGYFVITGLGNKYYSANPSSGWTQINPTTDRLYKCIWDGTNWVTIGYTYTPDTSISDSRIANDKQSAWSMEWHLVYPYHH